MDFRSLTMLILLSSLAAFQSVQAAVQSISANESSDDSTLAEVQEVLGQDEDDDEPLRFIKPNPKKLKIRSRTAIVVDYREGRILYAKAIDKKTPIASITKLMTAMVTLDAHLALDELIDVSWDDVDRIKRSRSRVDIGSRLSRLQLMELALIASDNRAAFALSRTYPGGADAFVAAMNTKARQLKMRNSVFSDATGLNRKNVSTARDLVLLVNAAYGYPLIREITSQPEQVVVPENFHDEISILNTNRLIRAQTWDIGLSKTGYIRESGHCLVMQADVNRRPLIIVLLNASRKKQKFEDARRIRDWLIRAEMRADHQNLKPALAKK